MKKGFTLIELLAVIVILAIIALISTPIIIGLIDDARKEAFKDTGYGIVKAGELLFSKDLLNGTTGEVVFIYTNGVESTSIPGKKLEYNGTKPKTGRVIINSEGKVAIAIHNGTYCVEKGYNDSEVMIFDKTESECILIPIPGSGFCGDNFYDSRDTNTYKTVQIGAQCWMAEDLRYDCSLKGYTNVGTATSWTGTNNCSNQGIGYTGLLYQWPVAMNGSTTEGVQGLCPDGWHIPTDAEWKTLEMLFGMSQEAANSTGWRGTDQGDQLKIESPSWCKGTTNCATSGFNALPAGNRETDGLINDLDSFTVWWTSSISSSNAWYRDLHSINSGVLRSSSSQASGNSVRCLLDQ